MALTGVSDGNGTHLLVDSGCSILRYFDAYSVQAFVTLGDVETYGLPGF